jgi:hypothetical protein
MSIRLQGDRDWNEVWRRLCEFAIENDLIEVMLDINAPWLHEGFHATWRKKGVKVSASQQWQVEVPLVADGRVFGRTRVHSRRDNRISHHDIAMNLLKVTNDIEELVVMHSAKLTAAANPVATGQTLSPASAALSAVTTGATTASVSENAAMEVSVEVVESRPTEPAVGEDVESLSDLTLAGNSSAKIDFDSNQ